MNKIDFTDKVVIVTGATSGIGAEAAVAFATYGAKLTLVGRDEARILNTARRCKAKNKLVPLWLLLDLSLPGSCETVISKTVEMYERIDVLVNCAGTVVFSTLHDTSMDAFDEVMNINFRVPYYLSQLALPYLIKTKGNIVNMGSSMSKRFKPGSLPFIISKAALEIMTKHAAPELLADGVRINTISPGATRTNILANLNLRNGFQQPTYEELASNMPNGEVIEATEVAMLICLTASDIFPSLNGSELIIDGAASMA